MARKRRQRGRSDVYHVVVRGVNRMPIFTDRTDRERFLSTLRRFLQGTSGQVWAWCLMGNHAHLLVHMPIEELSGFMKRVEVSYAIYFNRRHGRVGHLFQDRFKSRPVDTESYLVSVVRYIHGNPEKAGIASAKTWPWSSMRAYLGAADGITCTDVVAPILRGREEVSGGPCEQGFLEPYSPTVRVCDELASEAADRMASELGDTSGGIREAGAALLKRVLHALRESGYPIAQIARVTGTGRAAVLRA